ncbi:hypothetical protein C0995_007510 [Termitomyces sp. Mi166|nr:hypothetical protein C0995_007510 [Termitomyces sp. Mi166\
MLSSTSQLTVAATSIILVALWSLYAWRSNSKDGRILPPGPTGIPLVGNLLQVPSVTIILIGDIKVAKNLLEKHSAKHSSRPNLYYLASRSHYIDPDLLRNHVDPMVDFWALGEERSEAHSIGRRLTNNVMSVVRTGKTELLQEFEAVLNVQHLLDDGGKNWFHHIERVGSSTVLTAAFGLHCPTGHEPELREIFTILAEIIYLTVPTASITNFFPFLDLIPGPMSWRIRARSFRERHDALYEKLTDHAMRRKSSGMDTWAATFVGEDKPEGDQRRLMRQFAATTTALRSFVLACIRYPEWIAMAQKEIDTVVGPNRLPSFKDRPFLPYIEAVVRETLRWRPARMFNASQSYVERNLKSVVRFGLPHSSTAEDTIEHKGQEYFIPKGSIIFPVTWAIEHDQSKFADHDRFMPERFLDSQGKLKPDYETSAFGFGRRVCPGVPFAERSLWIDIVTMLWTFDICASDEVDPDTGLPFRYDDSDTAFCGDLSNSPLKFPATFEPRSLQRAEVARREWAEFEKDLSVLMPGTT